MTTTRPSALGKVFVSYTATDRRFVRRLARRLEEAGFPVWLDEMELRPGDGLAREIAEALRRAKVVLLVVSPASVRSKWLQYELNLATERMVKGECRVIPIVIGDVTVPSEVAGVLYSDARSGLAPAMRGIVTALEYEKQRAESTSAFYLRADRAVAAVFGGRAYVSSGSEYKYETWESVSVPVPSDEGDPETGILYESVSAHGRELRPLSERWWEEFREHVGEVGLPLSLVVTERPIGFSATRPDRAFPSIALRGFGEVLPGIPEDCGVWVELGSIEDDAWIRVLTRAKELLIELAERRKVALAAYRQTLVGRDRT